MKTTIFMLLFLCSAAALAQVGGGSFGSPAMSDPMSMASHASHAGPQQLAQEQSLLEGTGQVYIAHGEVPLWEVAPKDPPAVPLGDVARAYRKQHETARKAQFVYSQVGPE